LTDLPSGLADDEAANNAIKEAASRGWFTHESERIFPFFYYWDTPKEMGEYIQKEWTDFMQLEEETFSAAQFAWAAAAANCRVRVRFKMLLTCWRKE
jgi:hypothetical protein